MVPITVVDAVRTQQSGKNYNVCFIRTITNIISILFYVIVLKKEKWTSIKIKSNNDSIIKPSNDYIQNTLHQG